jgi:hypothetical protein
VSRRPIRLDAFLSPEPTGWLEALAFVGIVGTLAFVLAGLALGVGL